MGFRDYEISAHCPPLEQFFDYYPSALISAEDIVELGVRLATVVGVLVHVENR